VQPDCEYPGGDHHQRHRRDLDAEQVDLDEPSAAMNRILPSLLREYRQSHPAVQLRLTAMDTPRQLEALAEGRLDAAPIRPRPSCAAGVARVIHREALCVALAADHPLARSHTLHAADLGNEAFIVTQVAESSGFRSRLKRLAAAGRFPIKIVHDADDFETALSMAAGGYGLVLGPESMCGLGFSEVVFRRSQTLLRRWNWPSRSAQPSPLRASAPSSMQPSRSGGVESMTPPVALSEAPALD
jgi:DNA-binding transcriptional LysR family regulator